MSQIVLEKLTKAFPGRRVKRAVYYRFEIAPGGSVYVPHSAERAHVPVSQLYQGRFPNNSDLEDYCVKRCAMDPPGKNYWVLPNQIDRVIGILRGR